MPSTSHSSPLCRIGEAAKSSGVSAANIRFYERQGLLKPQAREDNDYRLYSDADLHRLRFIRVCRSMDMSLDEVRALLDLDALQKSDCALARQTLDTHVQHVRKRLNELTSLERELKALRQRCDGTDEHCHIIEALHERADESMGDQPARRTGHV
jgi:DNA-binding transcriptional MerR regulator